MARRAARGQTTLFDAAEEGGSLETGVLHRDENLSVLRGMPSDSVDLIYLDPPFFSNRTYELIWGDEAEVRSFEDRWQGGIQVYINWMKERVEEMRRVLKPTGSIYLHCDWHASHHLRLMMDEVFGANLRGNGPGFQNEIIWCYRGGGVSKRRFGRKHDTILFYAKGKEHFFEPQFVPYSESTRQVTARTGRRVNRTKIDLDRGGHMPDWWTDMNALQTWSPERLGYPTQKPEALLERIITASSKEGDVVLDPFCGCGTTVAVADRLGREWVGIDISATALQVMERRLLKQGRRPRIVNAVQTVADLKELKPFEFQNWIINAIFGTHSPKKVGDMGIDGYWFFTKEPIQVKQSEHVGRNVVDNFETAIRRAKHTAGYIIAFSFTKGAVEEAARARKEGVDIRLIKVAEVVLQVKRPHGKFGPQPADVEEMPLPPPRKPSEMPSAEELVESGRAASKVAVGGGRVAAKTKARGPRSRGRA